MPQYNAGAGGDGCGVGAGAHVDHDPRHNLVVGDSRVGSLDLDEVVQEVGLGRVLARAVDGALVPRNEVADTPDTTGSYFLCSRTMSWWKLPRE